MININHIKKFNKGIVVYDDLSLNIPEGSKYFIVCKNGEGKTTLTRLIKKLISPEEGSITYENINEDDISILYDNIDRNTYMRVDEYMDFFARCYHVSNNKIDLLIDDLLKKYGLFHLKLASFDSIDKGSKKIISLLTTIMADKKVIVLDSPYNLLNEVYKNTLLQILESECDNKTIILLSDDINSFMDISTHIAILERGKCILQGEKNQVLREYGFKSYIEIETDKDIEDEINLLKDIEGIKDATYFKNKFFIVTEDIDHDYQILKLILDKGISVKSYKRNNRR